MCDNAHTHCLEWCASESNLWLSVSLPKRAIPGTGAGMHRYMTIFPLHIARHLGSRALLAWQGSACLGAPGTTPLPTEEWHSLQPNAHFIEYHLQYCRRPRPYSWPCVDWCCPLTAMLCLFFPSSTTHMLCDALDISRCALEGASCCCFTCGPELVCSRPQVDLAAHASGA